MLLFSSVVVWKSQTAKETDLLISYPGESQDELRAERCQVWNANRIEKKYLLLFCPFQ